MKMEDEIRKHDGGGSNDNDDDALDSPTTSVKRLKNHSTEAAGDLDDDIMDWLSVNGETMDELMKLLDDAGDEGASSSSPSSSSGSPVKFIENPYSSPLIFQSSCSYITINGNEESCGSSFSDWECSVMASVDMAGVMMRNGEEKASERDEFCEWFQGGWGIVEARGVDGGGGAYGNILVVESEG